MKSGSSCVSAIQAVNSLVESQYFTGNLAEVTDIFNATSAFEATSDKRPVLWYVTDIMAELIQYGHRVQLCKALNSVTDAWDMLKEVSILGSDYGLSDPSDYAVDSLSSLMWTSDKAGRQW